MFQVNYIGMRKRDTYDEIVNSLENDTLKLKYPDRAATFMLNSQQVSNIKYGTSLEVDEMHEKLNKSKIIENIVNQMSSNTNTHHTYNNYHFKPSPDTPAAGVDDNMDDGLDRRKNTQRTKLGHMMIEVKLKWIKILKLLKHIFKVQ